MKEFLLAIMIAALLMSATLIPLARKKGKPANINIWRTVVLGFLVLAAAAAMFYPAFSGK